MNAIYDFGIGTVVWKIPYHQFIDNGVYKRRLKKE
jgi:hypothetical protein